jgi:hypothetical protein
VRNRVGGRGRAEGRDDGWAEEGSDSWRAAGTEVRRQRRNTKKTHQLGPRDLVLSSCSSPAPPRPRPAPAPAPAPGCLPQDRGVYGWYQANLPMEGDYTPDIGRTPMVGIFFPKAFSGAPRRGWGRRAGGGKDAHWANRHREVPRHAAPTSTGPAQRRGMQALRRAVQRLRPCVRQLWRRRGAVSPRPSTARRQTGVDQRPSIPQSRRRFEFGW